MTAVAEPTVPASGKPQVVHSDSLKITEVFQSVQGESSLAGWPTVFIRLTGCPLRCQYCDTAYAFHGGQRQSLQELLQQVASYQTRHVCVTGGEP
jgi:7-carboxy-7-deazaguanine synthase